MTSSVPSWVQVASALDAQGRTDDAIDIFFGHINVILEGGRAGECDALIGGLALEGFSTTVLVALLSITKPASRELPNRSGLVVRIREILAQREPNRVEGLLRGLE